LLLIADDQAEMAFGTGALTLQSTSDECGEILGRNTALVGEARPILRQLT